MSRSPRLLLRLAANELGDLRYFQATDADMVTELEGALGANFPDQLPQAGDTVAAAAVAVDCGSGRVQPSAK